MIAVNTSAIGKVHHTISTTLSDKVNITYNTDNIKLFWYNVIEYLILKYANYIYCVGW